MRRDEEVVASLVGRTIASAESIQAEYGRTYKSYLCLTFTEGTKAILAGAIVPYEPNPSVEEMKKAPQFFSPEDIAEKVLHVEQGHRKALADARQQKERRFEQLKQELGK